MKKDQKVDFNKKWTQSVTKEQFIEHEKHHADIVDLGQAWEDLQEKKHEKTEDKEVKKK